MRIYSFGQRVARAIRVARNNDPQGDGAPGVAPRPKNERGEMPFLDHLEELRWAIIRSMVGVGLAMVLCAFFSKWIINELLLGPTRSTFFMYDVFGVDAVDVELLNRTITGQFMAHLGTIAAVGFIVGSPVVVYNIWRFIAPGLYPNERVGMRFSTAFATFFFVSGIAFGYLVLTPLALQFFANYQISDAITNQFDITRYFSMVTIWAFGTGVMFELPVVIFFLSKLGIITPEGLRKYRRYAYLGILIVAALFTPPDAISQIIVAIPIALLYEVSIVISRVVNLRRDREIAAALE